MHGWRGAHAWCVRDERALHACVHACEALCSERADAAHPGALAVQTSFVFARWSGGVLFCTAKVKSTSSVAPSHLSTGRGSLARCSTAHATVCAYAAAAECQLRRVIDTLAGLPSAIDTLTGASFSRTRTAAIYKAVVVLSQAQILD